MDDIFEKIKANVSKVIIGKEDVIQLLLASLAAGGHVLLEDVPGTGKTVLAKSLAKSMDFRFKRVQFTPDLLPSDVVGLSYYNQDHLLLYQDKALRIFLDNTFLPLSTP